MKNGDSPPFWLFFYQNSRPLTKIQVKFKVTETSPNWLSFIFTPPNLGENIEHHPSKINKPLLPSGYF